MKHFFDLTFRPFFVLTGMVTTLGALNAFWPQWTVEKVELIPFNQDYTIILQHWGIMPGVVGVFMIVAAFRTEWRTPILIIKCVRKSLHCLPGSHKHKPSLCAGLLVRRRDGCHDRSLHHRLLRGVRL
jgi:hypothetical protein